MDPKPGSVINDKYRVERILGEHGAKGSAVVAARQLDDNALVAIQIMPVGSSARRVATRFARSREVRSVHMPTYLDVGCIGETRPYVVMTFLEGMNLRLLQNKRPADVATAVGYVLQACDAVAAAHAINFVHRTLSTSSLFYCTSVPENQAIKVLDFPLVPPAEFEPKDSEGFVEFEAPETFGPRADPDRRCDIWSLGVVLYELLTGKVPFTARTRDKLVKRICESSVEAPSSLRKDVPKALDDVVLRCLDKNAASRWPTIPDLALALAPFASASGQAVILAMAQYAAQTKTSSQQPSPLSVPMPKPPVANNIDSAAAVPALKLFDTPDEGGAAFRRMTKDGRIEGMNAESVVSYNRARRVAKQTEVLAKQGPRVQAPAEDEGDVRAIGDSKSDPGPQLVSGTANSLPPAQAAPGAPAPEPPRGAENDPRAARIVGILILSIAVIFGLLVGAIWKLVVRH